MKIDPETLKEKAEPTLTTDRPIYPYGLVVRLDEDAIKKLGIELPKVDSDLLLTARVCVTSVSSNEHTGSAKGPHMHRNIELQIEAMSLDAVPEEKDAATELYKD